MRVDCRFEKSGTLGFLRLLVISSAFIFTTFILTGRVNAAHLSTDILCGSAYPKCPETSKDYDGQTWQAYPDMGDYIDGTWYYLLDYGQYDYLENRQYNLMGESAYLLGHPAYPKLFERGSEQAVGFAGKAKTGWFDSGGGQAAIIEYAMMRSGFNAGDLIDKVRYYYLDKGQYYYLDKEQYNLLGGLGYMFGRTSYLIQHDWDLRQLDQPGLFHNPEPATIGFLGLGALLIFTSRRYNEGRQGKLIEPNRR